MQEDITILRRFWRIILRGLSRGARCETNFKVFPLNQDLMTEMAE